MKHLKSRLNRVEGKLYPPGRLFVIIGHTREEVEKKYAENLEKNPNAYFVVVQNEEIKKDDE